MTFGERLAKARKQNNLNQSELAEMMGFAGNSLISRFEKNQSFPNFEHLLKMQEILEVDLHWLITGEETDIKKALEMIVNADHEALYKKNVEPYSRASGIVFDLEQKKMQGDSLTEQEVELLETNNQRKGVLHTRLLMLHNLRTLAASQLKALLENLKKSE